MLALHGNLCSPLFVCFSFSSPCGVFELCDSHDAMKRDGQPQNESVVPVCVVVQAVGIFYLRAHPLACAPRSLLLKFSAQFEMPSNFLTTTTTTACSRNITAFGTCPLPLLRPSLVLLLSGVCQPLIMPTSAGTSSVCQIGVPSHRQGPRSRRPTTSE